jgi:competence protein ComEA
MKLLRKILPVAALLLPLFAAAEPVDVNTADAETISKSLKGVGMSKAEAIIEYRKKHGPFRNADELTLVKGIGERTIELNRADIKVGSVEQ